MMFRVNISNLPIALSQLHAVLIQLVIVDNLVDLFDPLVVHEHLVISLSNHLLPVHKLLILRFHLEPIGLDIVLLIQSTSGLLAGDLLEDVGQTGRVFLQHRDYDGEESVLLGIFAG